jgi:hypothetical protein
MHKIFANPQLILAVLSIVSTWIFNNVVTVMVSSLPAPTKDSTPKYVYWFKVANTIIGNWQRAKIPRIENSPNWEAAVCAHLEKMKQEQK